MAITTAKASCHDPELNVWMANITIINKINPPETMP